jgi:hypothetical protein
MQSRPAKGSPAGSRARGPAASQACGRAKPARRGPKQPGPPRPKQRGQRPSRPCPTVVAIKLAVRVWNPNHPASNRQPPFAQAPLLSRRRHRAVLCRRAVQPPSKPPPSCALSSSPFPLLADQSQGPSPAMEAGRRGTARSSPASSDHEDRRCKPGTAEPPHRPILGRLGTANRLPSTKEEKIPAPWVLRRWSWPRLAATSA